MTKMDQNECNLILQMAGRRRPLLHSKSVYRPPLTRASQSSPGPHHSLPPGRSLSCRSDPQLCVVTRGRRSSSADKPGTPHSVGSLHQHFSTFISVSSQVGHLITLSGHLITLSGHLITFSGHLITFPVTLSPFQVTL